MKTEQQKGTKNKRRGNKISRNKCKLKSKVQNQKQKGIEMKKKRK